MASTLSDEETEIVRSSIPEKSNKIAATAVIRLYTAFPDFEDWIYTGLEGAIVLLYDLSPPYGIWLRIVDISKDTRGVIWEQEVPQEWDYEDASTSFHTFDTEECIYGLSFANEEEAGQFHGAMKDRESNAPKTTQSTPFEIKKDVSPVESEVSVVPEISWLKKRITHHRVRLAKVKARLDPFVNLRYTYTPPKPLPRLRKRVKDNWKRISILKPEPDPPSQPQPEPVAASQPVPTEPSQPVPTEPSQSAAVEPSQPVSADRPVPGPATPSQSSSVTNSEPVSNIAPILSETYIKIRKRQVSELIQESKLRTALAEDGSVARHIPRISTPVTKSSVVPKGDTWERRRELGTGAFGQVYLEELVDGEEPGKLRAVKVISKRQYEESKAKEIHYTRELEAIAKFSHPKYVHCFVQSFGWYESDRAIYIAMEYAEKGNLQSFLTKVLPEEEVKQITHQILEGLQYMHENDFAHRDLKPANILVFESSPTWWVKITDFGISKRVEEGITTFHTLVGTKGYLAPEILGLYCPEDLYDENDEYTASVDLWSLGVIMFMLLTNELVFSDQRDLGKYVVKKEFPKDSVTKRGVSQDCVPFLEEVMAPSPKHRPSAHQALQHAWLSDVEDPVWDWESLTPVPEISRDGPRDPKVTLPSSDLVASGAWPSEFE